jgi:hypothetical protein
MGPHDKLMLVRKLAQMAVKEKTDESTMLRCLTVVGFSFQLHLETLGE